MKFYLLQSINTFGDADYENVENIKLFCKKPTVKELEKLIDTDCYVSDSDIEELLKGKVDYITVDSTQFVLKEFELDNKKILNNMDEELIILASATREELDSYIDGIFINDITKDKIDKEIKEIIEEQYVIEDYDNGDKALDNLLENGDVWVNDYDCVFKLVSFNTNKIK